MHIPVLLQEVLDGLKIKKGDTVVDGTLGDGGYTVALCSAVGKTGTVVGIDQDKEAIERFKKNSVDHSCNLHIVPGNFRQIKKILDDLGISRVDRVALDLGMSSTQLEHSGRGFSFKKNEPLIMTFNENPAKGDLTAEQIVNNWSEESIANVLFGYGGEKSSRKIAKAIVDSRNTEAIKTTKDLVNIIERVMPRHSKIHPATKVFQALRIAVNDELENLNIALADTSTLLSSNGRIAVVSFHSLEDRIVKKYFKNLSESGVGDVVNKKIITPSSKEKDANPRSRSAKLRIFNKK